MDIITRSNCCDVENLHLFLRKSDRRFAPRKEVPHARSDRNGKPRFIGLERSHETPHLLDWNHDGRTDLVLAQPMDWSLQVATGPLAGKPEIVTSTFPLPALADRSPYDFQFTDWDGDGTFDMLFAGAYLDAKKNWIYDIYWCRNVSREGVPRFEPPVRLLEAPAQSDGWQYGGFAVRSRGEAGQHDLVVGVSKDWKRLPERPWTNKSRLMLYRQNRKTTVAPAGGDR